MNEHTSKKILYNKSTLLSLKAELLKKQEEVYEKKQLPQHRVENFKPQPVKASDDNEKFAKSKKSFRDNLKETDIEEFEACRKSKAALEKKAELYDHLTDGAGNSQLGSQFLVDFNTKKQQESLNHEHISPPTLPEPVETSIKVEMNNIDNEDDSEWTEFTDCLGRTRKCLKSDIDLYMERDRALFGIMTNSKVDPETDAANDDAKKPESSFLVQRTNDYLQSLREKWEDKERELLAKNNDIHYQDVLFDEARMHGVAYYSFSTDETERRKQMEELVKRREETLRGQKDADEKRKKRDELLAARVAAARARQRARAGLPPEEPQETVKDFTTCLLEFLTQQKDEADSKAKEQDKKIREEQEKERQKLREAYVREWDLGKDGVDDKVKKFREMTQEEYVEQQRAKRIDEFAPPQTSTSNRCNYAFTDRGKTINAETGEPVTSKSWEDVRPRVKTPPPPNIGDISEVKGLYFSTAKKPVVKNRNFIEVQEPTPIRNELSDDESDTWSKGKRKGESTNTEIAPPPTYDYYGPPSKRTRAEIPFESDIREAFAQGAKMLEPKASNLQLPKHYDFTFD